MAGANRIESDGRSRGASGDVAVLDAPAELPVTRVTVDMTRVKSYVESVAGIRRRQASYFFAAAFICVGLALLNVLVDVAARSLFFGVSAVVVLLIGAGTFFLAGRAVSVRI